MLKIEKTEVHGWEPAIRGMRNPKNSWDRSDSIFVDGDGEYHDILGNTGPTLEEAGTTIVGENDHKLMMSLAAGGAVHAKYRRMIVVWCDITAPLYWWKEFDTYKVGTVANSCSTMHKIAAKPFELDDFSCEKLFSEEDPDDEPNAMLRAAIPSHTYEDGIAHPLDDLNYTITILNKCRTAFNVACRRLKEDATLTESERKHIQAKAKRYWWQMIQLLPSSYNQKRTIMLDYEVLAGIYPMRKNHKLDEWHVFCDWIKSLPYSELIIGEENAEE